MKRIMTFSYCNGRTMKKQILGMAIGMLVLSSFAKAANVHLDCQESRSYVPKKMMTIDSETKLNAHGIETGGVNLVRIDLKVASLGSLNKWIDSQLSGTQRLHARELAIELLDDACVFRRQTEFVICSGGDQYKKRINFVVSMDDGSTVAVNAPLTLDLYVERESSEGVFGTRSMTKLYASINQKLTSSTYIGCSRK